MWAVVVATVVCTVRLRAFVAISEFVSITWTVMLFVPVTVGMPEMIPVLGAKVRPVGSAPEVRDQVYGVTPPVAASVVL